MAHEYYSPQGRPQGGSFPPLYPQPFSAPVAKKKWWKRWWVWLLVGLVGSLLGCSLIGGGVFLLMKTLSDSPSVKMANNYYTTIEKQDYTTAYSYLDADRITLYTHPLTQDAYIQKANMLDVQEGMVTSHTVSGVDVEWSNGVSTASITVNVTRKGLTYPVEVQFLEDPRGWKIVSIDGI